MKKFSYKFRSIMVNNVEKVVPGTVFTKMVLEMDESSVAQHDLDLTVMDILKDRAWVINLFLSFMTVGGISAVLFGLVYVGFGRRMSPESEGTLKLFFLLIASSIFLLLWIFLSIKSSVDHKKREHVERERGKGNWRIVDEAKWDEFYRLLQISKRKREKDLEDFLNKK